MGSLARAEQGRGLSRGEAATRALEAAVAEVMPGTIIWGDDVTIEFPDGSRKNIAFPGLIQRPEEDGFLFVTGVSFPEDQKKIAAEIRGVATSLPEGLDAVPRVLVFRSDAEGALRTIHHARLSLDSPTGEIREIALAEEWNSGWPLFYVAHGSLHRHGSDHVLIRWTAKIDSSTMSMIERYPLIVTRVSEAGVDSTEFLEASRPSEGEVELKGRTRGRSLRVGCSTQCIVAAAAVLQVEW